MKKLKFILVGLFCINTFIFSAEKSSFEFEQDQSVPMVYLNLVLKVGSIHDAKGKEGLTSLAMKMLTRGTLNNSKLEFYKKLENLGSTIMVDSKGEGTIFRAAVLAENLKPFLELFEEALIKPKFDAEELRKLKKEQESQILEMKNNDGMLGLYHFQKFFYGDHPYANPIPGTRKSLEKLSYKDVLQFYTKYFAPQNLALFGVGSANAAEIEKWYNSFLMKLSAIHPRVTSPDSIPTLQIPSGRRALIVDKPKTTQTQIFIGGMGLRPEHPDFYKIALANHSFGGASFHARMMTELRVKRGWTYGASNTFRFGVIPRHYAMHLFPKTTDSIPAIELTVKLLEDFVSNGITKDEFEFAQDSIVNNSPFNFDNIKKRLDNRTNDYLLNFPKNFLASLADNIERVSYSDIKEALKFFHPDQLTLVILGDAKELKKDFSKLSSFGEPSVISYLEE